MIAVKMVFTMEWLEEDDGEREINVMAKISRNLEGANKQNLCTMAYY